MRRDAGRSMELQIQVVVAVVISGIAAALWGPWGLLAGPVGIGLFFLFVFGVGGFFRGMGGRSLRRLLELAERRESPPPDWTSLVDWSDATGNESRIFPVAADPGHPMQEPFLRLACQPGMKPDEPVRRALAEFVLKHPDRETSREAANVVLETAPFDVAGPVALAALGSPNALVRGAATHHLVFRALSSAPDKESFARLVREHAEKIGASIHPTNRPYLERVLKGEPPET